jgi:hypothetical protein
MNLQQLLTEHLGLHHSDYPCWLDGQRVFPRDTLPLDETVKILKVTKYLYSVQTVGGELSIQRLSLRESQVRAKGDWYDRLALLVEQGEA